MEKNNKYLTSLINPKFLQRLDSYTSYFKAIPKSGVRERQLALFAFGHLQSRIESWAASSKAMDYRYPLLDKRIVEFAVGITPSLYYNQGISRYIFKHAVADLLPANICNGSAKSEPERVKNYLRTSLNSHKIWLNMQSENLKACSTNKYIEVDSLVKTIRSPVPDSIDNDLFNLIMRSDATGIAIMLMGLIERTSIDIEGQI